MTDPSRKPLQRRHGGTAGHVQAEQPVIIAGIRIWLALRDLPRTFFGVCPGLRQGRRDKPALTEWLTDLIDALAGVGPTSHASSPIALLSFGVLEDAGIQLQMMTTNLSARRPYSLPFTTHSNQDQHDGRYAFNEAEWKGYFPPRVMRWLHDHTLELADNAGYRYLPDSRNLPVVVAVRLSLSFPILLAAVPLYRQDWTYLNPRDRKALRRCIFSDGGISSNFPIHFFDSLLPTRPTFAIALDDYDAARYTSDQPQDRVTMPQQANAGFLLPIESVTSLPSFAAAIVNTARNWQDNLQSILSGYRERIAHIALTHDEGGLNLNMPQTLIDDLNTLGSLAGERMLHFDLEEHQWRRFLVAYARLEDTFERMNVAYANGFATFLNTYPPNTLSYKPTPKWFNAVHERVNALIALTAPWSTNPLRVSGHIPKPDTDLRITPKP